MYLTWADLAQLVVAGLGGILGIYLLEEAFATLRRRGLLPGRWDADRDFLVRRKRRNSTAVQKSTSPGT